MGFGGGSGGKGVPGDFADTQTVSAEEGGGGGGGGGGSSTPVAIIEISGGDVKISPITDATRIALSGTLFAAWAVFWLMLTVRTIARETGKTRRTIAERST
jgi:uncharacterized spore protein YtfJ